MSPTKKDWAADVGSLLGDLGNKLIGVAASVAHSALGDEPFQVLPYRGYGNGNRAWIYGRVVEKRSLEASTDADSVLRNLLNTYRRADSDPLPFATVTVEYAGSKDERKADNEGFFGGWIEPDKPATDGDEWQDYKVELTSTARPGGGSSVVTADTDPSGARSNADLSTSHADADTAKATGDILVPPPTARFCVISDLDDTVIQSRVSNFLLAARTVMLGNARTRLPFPGVAAFYDALRNGASGDEKNPIFYVSSSPWNIYDVIAEFMELQKIPKGPLILRDWDIGWSSFSSDRHFTHKAASIRNIVQLYPELDLILIGDTSQHDPEIYRQIVSEFPNRVKAIYIRDVTRTAERSASVQKLADEVLDAHSTLILSEDTLGAAKHAVEHGWISSESLPRVREEKRADEGKDDTKVATPEGGKPGSGEAPKVIGDAS
jgi:phosphatidate phosphatase APP1